MSAADCLVAVLMHRRGGVRHPIISTVLALLNVFKRCKRFLCLTQCTDWAPNLQVLYLTPAGLGGPTLVTDQTLKKEKLATRGWLVHPRANRLAGFDGALLHGVVPGRGVLMRSSSSDGHEEQEGSQRGGAARRVTFMAAFWRGPMSTTPRADRMPGSSQPIRKCCLTLLITHVKIATHFGRLLHCCQRRLKPFASEDTRGPRYSQHPMGLRMAKKNLMGLRMAKKPDGENRNHQKRRRFLSVEYGHV
jgi:hypothetical protein